MHKVVSSIFPVGPLMLEGLVVFASFDRSRNS